MSAPSGEGVAGLCERWESRLGIKRGSKLWGRDLKSRETSGHLSLAVKERSWPEVENVEMARRTVEQR